MRRTAFAGLMLVLQAMFVAPANASAALSPSLSYTPVWNATGVKITFTYKAPAAGYPCPTYSPIGNPVRFRMDGTIFSDGTLLDSSCTATATRTLAQANACTAHTFTAALHNAGDSTTASETGQASIMWPADYPTMGPYGCRTPGPIPPSSTPVHQPPPHTSATATHATPAPTLTPTLAAATHPAPTAAVDVTPSPSPTTAKAAVHTSATPVAPMRAKAIDPSPSATTAPASDQAPTAIAAGAVQSDSDLFRGSGAWVLTVALILIAAAVASAVTVRLRRPRQ